MFELPVQITSRACALSITIEQMHKIELVDDHQPTYSRCLGGKLESIIGVFDFNMNPNYGLYLFLSIEAEYDTLDKWKEIFSVIEDHLNTNI